MREPPRPQDARRELAGLEPNRRKGRQTGLRRTPASLKSSRQSTSEAVCRCGNANWERGSHMKTDSLRSDRKERQRTGKRSKKERRALCAMAGLGV